MRRVVHIGLGPLPSTVPMFRSLQRQMDENRWKQKRPHFFELIPGDVWLRRSRIRIFRRLQADRYWWEQAAEFGAWDRKNR